VTEGGSVWHIWDLHVHTPCSWLHNEYGSPEEASTWETYIQRLEEKCTTLGVAAVGVTDYFSIEGYKRLRKAKTEEGRLQNILLIPNIEFRLNTIVYPKATESVPGAAKRVNFHVLLSPDLEPGFIEDNFLHRLTFVEEESPFGRGCTRVLNEQNLLDFGQKHIEQDERFRDRRPMDVACSLAVVSEDQIKKYLFDDDASFRGKALIVLAEENTSVMAWGSGAHAIRQKLVQMSQAVFSANESSRKFYLGQMHPSTAAYISEFGSIKPCYWGSDTHSYEERFLEPDLSRYLWLKSNPTWEGLRQTLFEPDERVSIGRQPPGGAQSSYTLTGLEIGDTSPNGERPIHLSAGVIPLNKGLVAVIGGRGSGKTALLDILAAAYATGKKEIKSSKTSFVSRAFTTSGPADGAHSISVTYTFLDGQQFHTEIDGGDWATFEGTDITYLQQGHFDNITGDPHQLKEQILKLVFDRLPEEAFAYQQLCQKTVMARQKIKECNARIGSTLIELEPMSQLTVERDLARGHAADLKTQLANLDGSQGSDETSRKVLEQKVTLAQWRSSCESLLLRLEEASQCASSADHGLSSFNWTDFNSDLARLAETYPNLTELPADAATGAVSVLEERIESSKGLLTSLRQELSASLAEISKTTDSLDQHQRDIEHAKLELQDTETQLHECIRKLEHLSEIQQKADVLKGELRDAYLSLVKAHKEERDCLDELLRKLTNQGDADISGLTFAAEFAVDDSELVEGVSLIVNKNQLNWLELEGAVRAMCDAASDWAKDPLDAERKQQLEFRYDEVFRLSDGKFKKNVTRQAFVDALLDDNFSVQVEIGFQGVPVELLSMGQRAVILLKLVLASGDGPLLLDQPEADLDNIYLYQELVPAIRRAKKRRQIIIASHNANLVVSADAEEVIIAHCSNRAIRYDIASLEDLGMREQITQVLEGGLEAFELRERKYGMSF